MENKFWVFSEHEKTLISSFVAKGKIEQAKNERFAIIDLATFYNLFTDDEVVIMKKWLAINPSDIGYKLSYLGYTEPSDLVAIKDQKYKLDDKSMIIPTQYLPKDMHAAFMRLNDAMNADINKELQVLFGHRSPARQIFIFFDILERAYNFDFDKTIQRVCFPDYSEHVCAQFQAMDIKSSDGPPVDAFDQKEEYVWLKNNAAAFGFSESYAKGNELGMMYEPWHWRFEPTLESN